MRIYCLLVVLGSIFATLPRTQRGIPLVIKGDPKGKNILYCNGNSVVIRDIAVSLVAVLSVLSLMFSLLESGNIRRLYTTFSPSFCGHIRTLRILHSFRRSVYHIYASYISVSVFADNSGKIRIWDTTQAEHILKYEYQPIAGVIKDIVWSPDSKRIAVCGEGREK